MNRLYCISSRSVASRETTVFTLRNFDIMDVALQIKVTCRDTQSTANGVERRIQDYVLSTFHLTPRESGLYFGQKTPLEKHFDGIIDLTTVIANKFQVSEELAGIWIGKLQTGELSCV